MENQYVKKCITEKPHGLLAVKLAQQKNIMWQEINPLWVGEAWVKETVQSFFQDILSYFDFAKNLKVKLEGFLNRSCQYICKCYCVLSVLLNTL